MPGGQRAAPRPLAGDLDGRGAGEVEGHHDPGLAAVRAHQPATRDRLRQAQPEAGHGQRPLPLGHGDPGARRDPGGVRHPAVVVDEQQRATHRREHRGRRLPQPLEAQLVVPPQLGLGQPDGRLHQRDDRRVQGHRRPADVDDAEQVPGARVVDRGGRAVPGVLVGLEVLGGEQLHRARLGQRGPDRVGADQVLGPLGPLLEPEAVGPAADPRRPLAPQDDAVGVGDHHQELGGVGDRGDDRPQLVDHQRDRRRAPPGQHLLDGQRVARVAAVRVEPGAQHPRPRARDQRPRLEGGPATADHRVVHPHQLAGVDREVRPRPDRCEVAHGGEPRPGARRRHPPKGGECNALQPLPGARARCALGHT